MMEEEVNSLSIKKMKNFTKFYSICLPSLISAISQYQGNEKNNLILSEPYYYSLYENLRDNEGDWHIYFENGIKTLLNIELFCKILDTLVTIYRIRSNLKICKLILDKYEKILNRYNDIILTNSILYKDEIIIKTMSDVNYKFNINLINLWMENGCKGDINGDRIILRLRNTILFELNRKDTNGESSDFKCALQMISKPMTIAGLESCTNEDLKLIISKFIENSNCKIYYKDSDKKNIKHVFAKCSFCKLEEKTIGFYQICSICSVSKYCSRECQNKDWKFHKKNICIKKKKKDGNIQKVFV